MAELIDKGVLQEMFPCNGEGSWTYNVTVKAYIDSLPTTTEAEIRAMAIDKFSERILDYWDKRGTAQTILFLKDVAEQLKEE